MKILINYFVRFLRFFGILFTKSFRILILILSFYLFLNISYACESGDTICLFNENPTPAGFAQLSNPTSGDFQKLPNPDPDDFNKLSSPTVDDFNQLSNPSIENFEKILESATMDEFNKLDNSQKETFFSKDILNVNSQKAFFKSYLSNDLGLNVGEIVGNIKNFDGVNIEGDNQKVEISAIKDLNYGISVDSSGNLILIKNSGKISFEGDVLKTSEGEILINLNSGSNFKAINFDFKNSKINLKIRAPSKIDLGNGFSFIVNSGEYDFEIKKFDSYEFIKSGDVNKIYFDPKTKNLAGSGCCLTLYADSDSINIGKSSRKIGRATISKKEINVLGFSKFKLGSESFSTNDYDFLKNIISGKLIVKKQKSIDKSVTFFSKDDEGFIMNVELNIGKKRNSAEFVDDVNKLMDGFIENEIKLKPKVLKQVKSDWNWIKSNAKKLGFENDPKIKPFMESFEGKLFGQSNSLIPVNVFIDGLKSIKKKIVDSHLSLSSKDIDIANSKMDGLTKLIGAKKVSNFLQTNLPKNKKYAIGYDLIKDYGLGDLVKISGKPIINEDNLVFINTYVDGSSNIDFLATKNLKIPLKLDDEIRVINTQYRFIVSTKAGVDKLDAKVLGIEIDNYNLNRIVASSDFSKICAYLTRFNIEKCNN